MVRGTEMVLKPAGGMLNHHIEPSGRGKKVRGSGNELQSLRRSRPRRRRLVQLDDLAIGTPSPLLRPNQVDPN